MILTAEQFSSINESSKVFPILFSSPMVRAILEGRKTQTRRVMDIDHVHHIEPKGYEIFTETPFHTRANIESGHVVVPGFYALLKNDAHIDLRNHFYKCPYGQPGDRLWVRETWKTMLHAPGYDNGITEGGSEDFYGGVATIAYRAGGDFNTFDGLTESEDDQAKRGMLTWRPSIHMPHWAGRITLEIVSVRVERLQSINEMDAIFEGITDCNDIGYQVAGTEILAISPLLAYQDLWESINGPGSWDANPLVWVVEFKRVDAQNKKKGGGV